MKLYSNLDLHNESITLGEDSLFHRCILSGAIIESNGFAVAIDDCFGTSCFVDGEERTL